MEKNVRINTGSRFMNNERIKGEVMNKTVIVKEDQTGEAKCIYCNKKVEWVMSNGLHCNPIEMYGVCCGLEYTAQFMKYDLVITSGGSK